MTFSLLHLFKIQITYHKTTFLIASPSSLSFNQPILVKLTFLFLSKPVSSPQGLCTSQSFCLEPLVFLFVCLFLARPIIAPFYHLGPSSNVTSSERPSLTMSPKITYTPNRSCPPVLLTF